MADNALQQPLNRQDEKKKKKVLFAHHLKE